MAEWPPYKAGTAFVAIRPKLDSGFRAQLKEQLKPVKESLKVAVEPKLAQGFKSDLRKKVNAGAAGIKIDIEAHPKLATGFRASLRNLVREASKEVNAEIGVKVNTAGLRQRVRGATENMPDIRLNVDVDLAGATARLEEFRTAQAGVPVTLNVHADASAAMAQLLALRTLASSVSRQVGDIGTGGGIARTASQLTGGIFARPIRAIRLQVEIDRSSVARAEAEVANVAAQLSSARRRAADAVDRVTLAEQRHSEITSRSSSTDSQRTAATQRLARARRDLADAVGRVTALMGREADADDALDRARRRQGSLTSLLAAGWRGFRSAAVDALQDAASNVFSLSTVLGVAKVALVALAAVSLVPLLGQLAQAAGVIGLFPAGLAGAVSVFAAVKVGLTGVGDAFTAAGKAADSAGKDAEAHAKSVASAQKQEAAAARSVQEAQRGITSAERSVRNAQKESLDAQKALNRAREDATKNIDDLNRALGRTSLNEETAAIAVAEAQQELYKTFMDPNSTAIDRAKAQNGVKRALADQQDTIRESHDLAKKAAEANAKGVEGSDEVVSAKERVTTAAENEADAQQNLQDAYTRLSDAQTNLVEAQQATIDAMNKSSDAAEEYEKALGKLSPAARDFVQQMLALKPAFGDLRSAVQESLFDRLGDSVSTLANNWLPTLKTGLSGIATEINNGLRRAIADLDSDASRSKVQTIFDNVAKSIGPVLDGINDILQGFLSLSEVGSGFLPGLSGGFKDFAERFRTWAESDEGKQKFHDFLQESLDTFEKIAGIVVKLGKLVNGIFKASDATGEGWLDSIGKTLDRWTEFVNSEEGQAKIKKFFHDVSVTVSGIASSIAFIAQLINTVDDWMNRLGGWKSVNDKITEYMRNPLKIVWDLPGGGAEQLQFAKDAWGKFSDAIDEKAGAVVGWLYQVGTNLEDVGKKAVVSLTEKAAGALSGLKDSLPGILESVGGFAGSVGDHFTDVQTKISGVVDNLTGDSVFGKFKSVFDTLPGFFSTVMDRIGSAWDALPGKLATPINAVVDLVNGFGEIWNKVGPKLGLPEWAMLEHVGIGKTSGGAFDKPLVGARWMGGPGGPVRGPGGSKDDKAGLYRLSAGEHVWTADEVKAIGGHEEMFRLRRAALDGGGTQSHGDGPTPGYADGGIVRTSDPLDPVQAQLWDLVRAAIPDAVLSSGKRFVPMGAGYDMHMQGKAIDLQGPMDEISRWIYNTYPQSYELIHWPLNGWRNLKNGAPLDYPATTNEEHRNHVHWAAKDFLGALSDDEKKSLFDRIRDGVGGLIDTGRSFALDNLVSRPLDALVNQVPEFPEAGEFGRIPKAFAQKMRDAVVGFLADKLGGSGGRLVDYDPAGGGEQWRAMAVDAMRRVGFNADDPNQVNAMLAQIMSESGGNPNIAQQIVDVNGTGESAGVGLLQVIPGTFAAHRDPTLPNDRRDPYANMVAALRYYKSRYGMDLTEQWGHGHGYDQGGVLEHKQWGINMSGLPEAVLTNPQWKMFQDFVNNIPGFNNQLQALPQPFNGGTDSKGNPGTFGVPTNPGVDTWESLGKKTQERFKSAFDTGLNDFISANLGPLGIPDPREIPIVKAGTEYGKQLDEWQKARAAAAQASQALANSGYQAAQSPAAGSAERVVGSGNSQSYTNETTVINIYPADTQEAFRKAQQIQELRSLTRSARGR